MASCISAYGRPKIRHKTENSAFDHLNEMQQRYPDQYYTTYFCYVCYGYHVGRRKMAKQTYDEVLVGKLIAALIKLLRKETQEESQ